MSIQTFIQTSITILILPCLGPASYAQARIWLDERIRFDPDKPSVAIYNMPFLYRLSLKTYFINQTTSSSSSTSCH